MHRSTAASRTTRRPMPALASLALATLLAACAAAPHKTALQDVRQNANPTDRTQRTLTNFTPALRCMDDLMFRTGVRDLSLMMEELRDSTQRVPISARDMMTSALSDMTRRSRAVRLTTFGNDQAHLSQLLQLAQKTDTFAVLPQYSLRGAISQIDEDVQRRSTGFGATAARFGLRLGNDTRFSVLGFDAALVDTRDFTLVPGVTSKNTTVITRRDSNASDGQAQLLGTGVVFSFSSARSEGTAQAARNMVELAAVELVGKLAHLPYWQCLGLPDDHPEVRREMDDWYHGMGDAERLKLGQERLRKQRYYDGPADGQDSAAWQAAMRTARLAWAGGRVTRSLAQPTAAVLDEDFFRKLVTQALPAPGAVAADPTAAAAPSLALQLRQTGGRLQLELTASEDGYAYCYAVEKASGKIQRIFPNRFARDPAISAGRVLQVPGAHAITLPRQHGFACVHAPREVYADLPAPLRWGDFEHIKLNTLEAVRDAFAQTSGQPVTLVHASLAPP